MDPSRRELLSLAMAGGLAGAMAMTATPAAQARPVPGDPIRGPRPRGTLAIRLPLGLGASGVSVATLQRRLAALGYWAGPADGRYGLATQQAVMAVQKVAGLPRTGVCDVRAWASLVSGTRPAPRTRSSGRVVEVDRARQVVMVVNDGRLSLVLNTSTGKPPLTTPAGAWRFYRQSGAGWHVGPLGALYRPKYFHRGYAVHGSTSIPAQPASHGCVRVSVPAMDMLWGRSGIRLGDRVVVY